MAANTVPIFPKTLKCGVARISIGNSARDGTGDMSTVLTGGADGTRIDRVVIMAIQSTTLGLVRLFIGDDAGSPNIWLYTEVPVSAITVSATQRPFTATLVFDRGLLLPPNYTLRASTERGEAFNVIAHAADY